MFEDRISSRKVDVLKDGGAGLMRLVREQQHPHCRTIPARNTGIVCRNRI